MKGTARIRLGKTKSQEKRPYIYKHNAKGQKPDGLLSVLDDDRTVAAVKGIDLRGECRKAKEKMEELSIPLEEGPYADREGKVATLARLIRGRAEQNEKGDDSIIEKMIEVFGMGEGLPLEINEYLLRKSDELVVAGDVLTEMERRQVKETEGSSVLVVQDFFEGVILAVAVMRKMGFDAYPSYATWIRREGESQCPIISILNDKTDIPLVTFNLTEKGHPYLITAVDLMGDEAVLGVTYLFQARNTIRKLTEKMMNTMEQENRMLENKEVEGYIQTVADLVNDSVIRSGIPLFLQKTMGGLEVSATPELIANIPEMSPERIMLNGSPEMIGIFNMIKDAFSQIKLMEIQNNTEPENVQDVMDNTGIQMGILHDGLKMALEYRYKVFREYRKITEAYEDALN